VQPGIRGAAEGKDLAHARAPVRRPARQTGRRRNGRQRSGRERCVRRMRWRPARGRCPRPGAEVAHARPRPPRRRRSPGRRRRPWAGRAAEDGSAGSRCRDRRSPAPAGSWCRPWRDRRSAGRHRDRHRRDACDSRPDDNSAWRWLGPSPDPQPDQVFMESKKSELVLATRSLSRRKSIASVTPIGMRMRRSTHILESVG
jgi:hypothetical protein